MAGVLAKGGADARIERGSRFPPWLKIVVVHDELGGA